MVFSLYMLLMTPITYNVLLFEKRKRRLPPRQYSVDSQSDHCVDILCGRGKCQPDRGGRCDHDVDVWIQSDRVGCMLDLFFHCISSGPSRPLICCWKKKTKELHFLANHDAPDRTAQPTQYQAGL